MAKPMGLGRLPLRALPVTTQVPFKEQRDTILLVCRAFPGAATTDKFPQPYFKPHLYFQGVFVCTETLGRFFSSVNKPISGTLGPWAITRKLALPWVSSRRHECRKVSLSPTHPKRLSVMTNLPIVKYLVDQALIPRLIGHIHVE